LAFNLIQFVFAAMWQTLEYLKKEVRVVHRRTRFLYYVMHILHEFVVTRACHIVGIFFYFCYEFLAVRYFNEAGRSWYYSERIGLRHFARHCSSKSRSHLPQIRMVRACVLLAAAFRFNNQTAIDRLLQRRGLAKVTFQWACKHGHMDVLRSLLDLEGDRAVDVHAMNEGGFRLACKWDRLEAVRLLLALAGDRRIDVHADQEDAFN
jgi:hypothetical protein